MAPTMSVFFPVGMEHGWVLGLHFYFCCEHHSDSVADTTLDPISKMLGWHGVHGGSPDGIQTCLYGCMFLSSTNSTNSTPQYAYIHVFSINYSSP
ncbi:hypothetical protein VNO77_16196 [Canavalia gladiata]|uniref:Uncharacterized protein n=1 Tax=Canavalia gladiata TaxID=3824 RepID=A0AAN9QPP9_CANGL